MKVKVCLLYNFAQHYRLAIYRKLEQTFDIDFYFGTNKTDIKSIDENELKNIKRYFKRKNIYKPIYFLKGSTILSTLRYTHYIILAEYFNIANWILLPCLRLRGKKVILWTHGLYGDESAIKKKIIIFFLNLGNKILTYNKRGKTLLVNEGISESKIEVIYNSLDVESQEKVYEKLKKNDIFKQHFANTDKVLIYIGRLQFRKKINQILYALKILENEYNEKYNLVIIGDGQAKSDLIKLANELNISNRVWFCGALYDETEIGNLLYNADLAVSPGNIGLTAMHCFVYGLPFITHNNFFNQMPEYEIMEENCTGLFFKEDEIDDLARKINKWFQLKLNQSEVEKKCRLQILEHYNPDNQLRILKKCIKELQ